MIPKTIHQIWIGDRPAPLEWIDSWKAMNPDWDHVLWDNLAAERVMNGSGIEHLYRQDARRKRGDAFAAMADYLRLEILHKYGGLYVDADTYCIRPIPEEVRTHDFVTCYLNEVHRPGRLSNGVMGCEPQHALIEAMIEQLRRRPRRRGPAFLFSGPVHLTECASWFEIKVYPSKVFLPYFLSDIDATTDLSESISVHLWGTTARTSHRNISQQIIEAAKLDVDTREYAPIPQRRRTCACNCSRSE